MKKAIILILLFALVISAFSCAKTPGESADHTQPAETAAPAEAEDLVSFTGEDINGNVISMEALADKKVVMINFWETWCGPCMGELEDINKLYTDYKDRGFIVIGVYSSSKRSEVAGTVESLGITYPVMPMVAELQPLTTRYVPTTVFTDGSGRLLSEEPFVGARSYEEWESILLSFLGK